MLPSSTKCECMLPPTNNSWYLGEGHAPLPRASLSLLYHWSPFYQHFGHHQDSLWYHHPPQYPHQQSYEQVYQLLDYSYTNITGYGQASNVTQEKSFPDRQAVVSGQLSLDCGTATDTTYGTRSRRNSEGLLEEYKTRIRRKYDPKYSFKELHGRKTHSKQSEEIAQEFKRLGIGFCFKGTDGGTVELADI